MVSVIIPTHNRGDVICRSIESVLAQEYQDFEIIVVDDASTDETKAKIEKMKDFRVRYIRSEKKVGANGARNIGIHHAKGEFIAFQDSDDVWHADKLKKQLHMLEHQDVSVVFCRYNRKQLDGGEQIIPNANFTKAQLQNDLKKILAQGNVIGTPTLILKKECFDKIGNFDNTLSRFQDWELALRFVQVFKVGFVDEVLMTAHEMNTCITKTKEYQLESMLMITKKHRYFFEEMGTLSSRLGHLIHMAIMENRLDMANEILGEELFYKGIRGLHERIDAKEKNAAFFRKWLSSGCDDIAINQFFSKYPDQSIVIYGLGEIGREIVAKLDEDNKLKIQFIIEKNRYIVSKFPMRVIEELKEEDFKEVRCVLITAVAHQEEITEQLREITNVSIFCVSDIVNEA